MKIFTKIIMSAVILSLFATLVLGYQVLLKTDNPNFDQDPAFYKSLGNEMIHAGDLDKGIAAYEQSLLLSEDSNIRSNLAVLYYQRSQYSNAIRHLKVLTTDYPLEASYHYDLAVNLVDKFRNTEDKNLDDLYLALNEYKNADSLQNGYANSKANIAVLEKVLSEI